MADKPIKFTGLWKQKAASGIEYLSAVVETSKVVDLFQRISSENVKILCFKNNQRDGKNDPDWSLSLSPIEPKPPAQKDDLSMPAELSDSIPF